MHISPPSTTPRTPSVTTPPAKPAPAQGSAGDFSQLLKTAQAGTPATPAPNGA